VLEVAGVAGDDGEAVDGGDGGDEGVLHKGVGLAVHQLGPDSKGGGVDRQHLVRHQHTVEPGLKLIRFGGVLLSGDFDTGLDFADGDGGEIELLGRHTLQPVENGRMRRGTAEFGDDVGIEEVHALVELRCGAALELPARRCQVFRARLGSEQ